LAILLLALLDGRIVELLDACRNLQADQVVVVLSRVQLEDRLARLEVVPLQQAGLLELRQHAIDRGQADVHAIGQQVAVDVLRRHVARRSLVLQLVEEVENLESRIGRLEADILEVVGSCHGAASAASGLDGQL
jgi:hypothetical protein